jgi:hypothetical protein
VRFEKLYKRISTADKAAPCPECKEPARKLVSAANHTFKHSQSQTRGPLPPNTGTSDDWNADKAIGRDAAKRWAKIDERNREKARVLREAHKDGIAAGPEHLVRTRETTSDGREAGGSYRVITEGERKAVNAGRKAAESVRQASTGE